jgi:hypothetical protein
MKYEYRSSSGGGGGGDGGGLSRFGNSVDVTELLLLL